MELISIICGIIASLAAALAFILWGKNNAEEINKQIAKKGE